MAVPGAMSFTSAEWFEVFAIKSFFIVLPTAMAVEMHAGVLMKPVKPSFPDAMMVAIPALRRLVMAVVRAGSSASQAAACLPAPRLMFTAAIVYVVRKA